MMLFAEQYSVLDACAQTVNLFEMKRQETPFDPLKNVITLS